jgi:hypothetical protein
MSILPLSFAVQGCRSWTIFEDKQQLLDFMVESISTASWQQQPQKNCFKREKVSESLKIYPPSLTNCHLICVSFTISQIQEGTNFKVSISQAFADCQSANHLSSFGEKRPRTLTYQSFRLQSMIKVLTNLKRIYNWHQMAICNNKKDLHLNTRLHHTAICNNKEPHSKTKLHSAIAMRTLHLNTKLQSATRRMILHLNTNLPSTVTRILHLKHQSEFSNKDLHFNKHTSGITNQSN